MKKRILAVLLVLALVVVAGVVAVSATETGPTVSEEVGNVQCPCGCGLIKDIDDWKEWSTFNSKLATGHYYLTGDVTKVTRTLVGETSKVLLNLNGHSITTSSGYRGITVYSGGTATLIGDGTISAYAASAGVIEIGAGSTFNLYEATIKNINTTAPTAATSATAVSGTAVSMTAGTSSTVKTTFNMYSGELHGGNIYGTWNKTDSTTTLNGGAVAVNKYGQFNMYGGTLYGGISSSKNGNGVFMSTSTSEFNLVEGKIIGNDSKAANRGGLVYMAGGTMTMSGGEISGAKAGRGAGVFINDGTFTMSGGEISGNTSTSTGHAVDVYTTSATFTMTGGTITSDVSAGIGTIHSKSANVNISGGVVDGNICSTQSITVSGTPKIADVDLVTADLDKLAAATTIAIGADGLSEGASIGVTKTHDEDFTAPLTNFKEEQRAQFAGYFHSTTQGYGGAVNPETNALYLVKKCPHCNEAYNGIEWKTWAGEALNEEGKGGHYRLDGPVSASGQKVIGENKGAFTLDVCLDLNGQVANNTSRMFAVYPGSSLFVMDSVGGGELTGAISGETNQDGGVIRVDAGATFTLHSGSITYRVADGKRCKNGGAIATTGGTININGGTVTGKTAVNGGTIAVVDGTLNITGGIITGGNAIGAADYTGFGGNIYNVGTLNISGGTIQNGKAVKGDNNNTAFGGNIYNKGTLNITGGTITGGTTDIKGGNIYHAGGTVTISGGVIENGVCNYVSTATNAYGGGNIYTEGILNIDGGTIQNGISQAAAGNIMVRGTTTISDGKILGGTAAGDGDSIGMRANLTISGGEIDGEIQPLKDAWKTLTLSGSPKILNLNLNQYVSGTTTYSPVVTIGELSGADIKVQATNGVAFTSSFTEGTVGAVKANFSAYDATRYEVADNDDFALVLNKWGIEAPCYCEEHNGEKIIWTVLADEHIYSHTEVNASGATSIYYHLESDHYILDKNHAATKRITVQNLNNWGHVAINLNGHNWTYVKNGEMPFWLRNSDCSLFVTDTSGDKSGAIIGGAATYQQGGGVVRMTGGVFTLHSGTVKFDSTTAAIVPGGAIDLAGGAAKFIMNGGSVIGADTTGNGKAILVVSGCEVQLNGGTVSVPDDVECNDVIHQTGSSKLIIGENNANVDSLSGKIYMEAAVNADGRGVACIQKVADTEDEKTEQVWYKDAATAAKNVVAENVHYIKLLADGPQTLPAEDTYYVDINGKTVNITGAVKCFDSANDTFDATKCGTVTMVDPDSYVNAPNGNLYITVSEGDGKYSFHRLEMKFDSVYLRPSNAGIFYSSIWNGDEVLVGTMAEDGKNYAIEPKIIGYGMALKKEKAADSNSFITGDKFAYTYFENAHNGLVNNFLVNKKNTPINSCLLSGIIKEGQEEKNRVNVGVDIYATPYVLIEDYNGEDMFVMGPTRIKSLNDVVKEVVDAINTEKEEDVKAMNIQKITPLKNLADICGVTFDGLNALVPSVAPSEPTPETPAE